MLVRTIPGHTQLTLMLYGAAYCAMDCVMPVTPNLDVVYATLVGNPYLPAWEHMLTILPARLGIITRSTADPQKMYPWC